MTMLPIGIDPKLWFTMHGDPDYHYYLTGNSDTFPGRMSSFDPHMQRGFSVSKAEIMTCSLEARYWIEGFLWGNLPSRPCDAEGDLFPDDHLQMRQWEQYSVQFLETGYWPDEPVEADET